MAAAPLVVGKRSAGWGWVEGMGSSQRVKPPSASAKARRLETGEKWSDVMRSWWWWVAMTFLVSTSQTRILRSSPDEARYFPLGEKASSQMTYMSSRGRKSATWLSSL